MITKDKVAAALKGRIRQSVLLKKQKDESKTSTKRNYIHKKLVKNNLIASKLLVTLEKLNNKLEKENVKDTDAIGNSSKED